MAPTEQPRRRAVKSATRESIALVELGLPREGTLHASLALQPG